MKKSIWIVFAFCPLVFSQSKYSTPLIHTYSIVARDPATGDMGVAVQSHWFSVGSVVSWAEAGAGAIATQSFVNVSFGPRGLDLLKSGKTADETLDLLIQSDSGRQVRQLAIVDSRGNVAAYTGDHCIPEAGHMQGEGFSVQANLMLKNTVWPSMAKAFREAEGPLAERMIAALEAAEIQGGDIRGSQSASILVVRGIATDKPWEDRLIDLRVEDHMHPVQELKRLLTIHRSYGFMNAGDLAIENGDVSGALEAYGKAEHLFPENLEMQYWHAVSLFNIGMKEKALPILHAIFEQDSNWQILTQRLPGVNLLNADEADMKKLLRKDE